MTVVPHPSGLLLDVQHRRAGLVYATHADDAPTNSKLFHYLIEGDKATEIDWTPYHLIEPHELRLWLALGRPRRFGPGPLRYETLLKLVRMARRNDQLIEADASAQ